MPGSNDFKEEVDPTIDRMNSDKYLPLKKRRMMQQEGAPISPQLSNSSTPSPAEPLDVEGSAPVSRTHFTVAAPPMVTMATLMEIKTALTADDDGDLPLHIAVVHEDMGMVDKLVKLMRIAGRGVCILLCVPISFIIQP